GAGDGGGGHGGSSDSVMRGSLTRGGVRGCSAGRDGGRIGGRSPSGSTRGSRRSKDWLVLGGVAANTSRAAFAPCAVASPSASVSAITSRKPFKPSSVTERRSPAGRAGRGGVG